MIEYNFTGGSYRAYVKTTYRNGNSQEATVNSNKFPFIALTHEYVIFDSANHYINPLFATLSGRTESDFWKYQDDCSLLVRDTSSTHQCNFYYNVKLKRGNATKIGIKCKEQVKWASYYDSDVRFYRTPPSAYGWNQDTLVNEVFGIGWSNGGHSYPAGIDTLTGMTVERDLVSLVGNNEFYLGFYQNDSKFVIDKLWFDGEPEIVSATRTVLRSTPLRSTLSLGDIVRYDFIPGTYRAFVRTSYQDGYMQSHTADSNKYEFEATRSMPIITSVAQGIPTSWDGSEVTIMYSGSNNTLTVQVASSHIVFKLYTSGTEIYSFTSPVGSTTSDVNKIHVAFLKDTTLQLAKPSFIYETGTDQYSYNQESPTDTQMQNIYTWLEG